MVTFVSNYTQLRIVLRPTWVKREGLNQSLISGLSAQFQNGFYSTDNQEIIELLRKHPTYGFRFREQNAVQQPAQNSIPVPPPLDKPPVVKPRVVHKPKVKAQPDEDAS